MLLFAGLGNPGAKYANNRHNIGFMAVDAIARRHSFSPWSQEVPGPDRRRHDRRREGAPAQAADLHEPVRPVGRRGAALLQARARRPSPSSTTRSTLPPARCGSRSAAAMAATTASARSTADRQGLSPRAHRHRPSRASRSWCTATCSATSPRPTANGSTPLLDAIADNADLLVKGDDNGFMNKLALAVRGDGAERPQRPETADPTRAEGAEPHPPGPPASSRRPRCPRPGRWRPCSRSCSATRTELSTSPCPRQRAALTIVRPFAR